MEHTGPRASQVSRPLLDQELDAVSGGFVIYGSAALGFIIDGSANVCQNNLRDTVLPPSKTISGNPATSS